MFIVAEAPVVLDIHKPTVEELFIWLSGDKTIARWKLMVRTGCDDRTARIVFAELAI